MSRVSVPLSVRPSPYSSVNAGRNFFNLGKMMAYDSGLMPVWGSIVSDDPLPFYSTIYNIAVVNMVLSKYLSI